MLERLDTHDQLCLSLQHIKAQLRLDHAEDDDYLLQLMKSGTAWVENHLGRCLLKQTWRLTKNTSDLPIKRGKGILKIPKSPLLSIDRVRAIEIPHTQDRDILNYTIQWNCDRSTISVPSPHFDGKIEVVFTTGYGERPSDIPADIRQAILNHITCIYEERQGIDRKNLLGIYDLLQPYRLLRLS